MSSEGAVATGREKLQELRDRLLRRRVVPFLGAGVSIVSKLYAEDLDGRPRHDKQRQPHNGMTRRLRRILRPYLRTRQAALPASIASLKSRDVGYGLAELCETFMAVHQGPMAEERLVRALRIAHFADLEPTKTHRYIAFLAREGCIEEVITTNYDGCLEIAFLATYWGDPTARRSLKDKTNEVDSRLHIARDLASYQRMGTVPRVGSGGDRGHGMLRHGLTLFKVNGCAVALGAAESRGPEHRVRCAETILLTERQLQHWRARRWAADMFRDRLRSGTVLFCGFGSAEPQIRLTVSEVLEELSHGTPTAPDGRSPHLAPNAPCVVVFDQKHEPSFHQWQIATAFTASVGARPERARDLLYTPADHHPPSSPANLPADDFWSSLYDLTMAALFERRLCRDSAIDAYLKSHAAPRSTLRVELSAWVLGNQQRLLAFEDACQTPHWAHLLVSLLGTSKEGHGRYEPLVGHDRTLFQLLLILAAVEETDGTSPRAHPHPHGVEIHLEAEDPRPLLIRGASGASTPLPSPAAPHIAPRVLSVDDGHVGASRRRRLGRRTAPTLAPTPPKAIAMDRTPTLSLTDLLENFQPRIATLDDLARALRRYRDLPSALSSRYAPSDAWPLRQVGPGPAGSAT